MSDDIVIHAEGLAKKYVIGHQAQNEPYITLRDVFIRTVRGLLKSARDIGHGQPIVAGDSFEEFWALKDVNFDIERGAVVGIIGRNGAGKSTLLKILSRITSPSGGRVMIKGRVGSLLEVGTGFHPELTGRENIFLNGAVLGMTREEIRQKFDEIVAFSEIERFLDTPVKRYSSGMYVRLAFAVAAHLEPEVLLVDEVLAVGDAQFQNKCLGKLHDLSQSGRTVLFVSHNMNTIQRLCTKGLLLESGSITAFDDIGSVVDHYLSDSSESHIFIDTKKIESIKNQYIVIENISIEGGNNKCLKTGDELNIRVKYTKLKNSLSPAFVVSCKDTHGVELFRLSTMPISGFEIAKLYNNGCISLQIGKLPLVAGTYVFDVGLVREGVEYLLNLPGVIKLNIHGGDYYGSNFMLDRTRGYFVVDHEWSHEQI